MDPERGIHGVLAMPFSGFDLMNRISSVSKDFATLTTTGASRIFSVFAPKGGVGKTTLAFNIAVAIGQLDQRTVLIDGSLQFGDLRALLKVPVDAPSILDLPTDRVSESDLQDVLWRDPSGIDILLAPPRLEMAEMITARDVDKVLSLLRRVYGAIVIDMSSALSDINLAFLDLSDTILEIVTYDSTTIHNTIAVADAFRMIGYPASKVRYLVNRSDSAGGIPPADLERAIGRVPEHKVVSDGMLVVQSNNEGVPFVLANPAAPISQDIARVAGELLAVHGLSPAVAGRR
jgi:pilus assembly protein CpaE